MEGNLKSYAVIEKPCHKTGGLTINILSLFLLVIIFQFFTGLSFAQGPVLDKETAGCVDCHRTSIMTGAQGSVVCHDDGCGHPIAVDYARAASMNRGLKAPGEMNPSVKLADGMIGCTTCHVPYNEYDHAVLYEKRKEAVVPDPMLVIDNRASELCLGCHIK